jgi:hypothetical protein
MRLNPHYSYINVVHKVERLVQNMRKSRKIYKLLKEQVDSKVKDLETWKEVRWYGGRLYYETTKIINEISLFDIEIQIRYFEILEKRKFRIYDNAPGEAPDITAEFYNWVKSKKAELGVINCTKNEIKNVEIQESTFLDQFINGIHELQWQGDKAVSIENIKVQKKKLEEPFQYFFKTYFTGKFESVTLEVPKGNGRIDLSLIDNIGQTRIIEFKGWWNNTKRDIIEQIGKYFTEFENEGYVFLINSNSTKQIRDDYKILITKDDVNYVHNSWEVIIYKNTSYEYYSSEHFVNGRIKKIYHFIFNVY